MKQDQMIQLPNGQEVLNLTPTLEGQLAIVHLAVVKRLAELLPSRSMVLTRLNIIEKIQDCSDLETLISIMEEEVAFHKTVNLISTVEIPSKEEVGMM